MRADPGLDASRIGATLDAQYDLAVGSVTFLPISLDHRVAVCEIVSLDGRPWFLKATIGRVRSSGLIVPAALVDQGVPNIMAPTRTRSGELSCGLDGDTGIRLVLFPFIDGGNAKVVGLSDQQWRTFGATLRAVHDSGLGEQFGELLPTETFALPSAIKVRGLLELLRGTRFRSPVARRHAVFWLENAGLFERLLDRAEAFGTLLAQRQFDTVLCHGDIHAANILVAGDGRIFLSDWDGPPEPLIAPRERDLLFVIGSRIARPVEPWEERLFFEGYGPVSIDRNALVYFRYERIVQDLGEYGESVFLSQDLGEDARADDAAAVVAFFEPDGAVDMVEDVDDRWASGPSSAHHE